MGVGNRAIEISISVLRFELRTRTDKSYCVLSKKSWLSFIFSEYTSEIEQYFLGMLYLVTTMGKNTFSSLSDFAQFYGPTLTDKKV